MHWIKKSKANPNNIKLQNDKIKHFDQHFFTLPSTAIIIHTIDQPTYFFITFFLTLFKGFKAIKSYWKKETFCRKVF